jgi:AcrR family transcriptional regulator
MTGGRGGTEPDLASAPTSDRRHRKRERTHAELLAATARALSRKGLADLVISDITEEADVALGTFYNYFDSRDEALAATAASLAAEASAAALVATDAAGEDPADRFVAAFRALFDWFLADSTRSGFVVNVGLANTTLRDDFREMFTRLLGPGVGSGRFQLGATTSFTIGGGFLAVLHVARQGVLADGFVDDFITDALASMGMRRTDARAVLARTAVPTPR